MSLSVTGLPSTGMTAFDQKIIGVLTTWHIPGATLAVSRNGRVIIARGYGFIEKGVQTMPANRFRIASVSKPITAMAILHLIEHSNGQLTLETKIWDLLHSQYPLLPGRSLAPGVDQITVRQLLNHTAGWDNKVYDPMFDVHQIAQQIGVPPPADRTAIIRYMWSHQLAHIPGSQYSYANF